MDVSREPPLTNLSPGDEASVGEGNEQARLGG